MSFHTFELSNQLHNAIADLGFESPSEIQYKVIPVLKTYQGDFVGQAQTGTGKTAAFVIPLLEKIDFSSKNVQALILAPTRELANQVYEEVVKLAKYLPVRATTVYGGVPYGKQTTALRKDRPQIVVGTPGRIIDLINQKILKLHACQNLIIDEADEMLNMGFIEDVQTIIDSINSDKQMWMFSATMPPSIVKLIKLKFSNPKVVRAQKQTLSNEDIKQYYCVVRRKHFAEALQRFIDSNKDCFGIIFCETRQETKELAELLLTRGVSVTSLHGELSQAQRDFAMRKFKDKRCDYLICTDVAARGIDVSNVTHVFNIGLPRQNEVYVHRIGRTGRVGMKGTSISLVAPENMRQLKKIESLVGQKIEALKLPHPSELKKVKICRELNKMDALKVALVDKEEAFAIDPAFKYFQSYFQDLSKEQILKLLFSYRFNKEIRQLNDSSRLEVVRAKQQEAPSGRKKRGRNRRDGARGNSNRRRSGRGYGSRDAQSR
ncbi:MAG: DEAD/DEAH box helicase [Bacteriovoracaceae bacterium]|nr:DEAD/DEAH box helicase [Bacteriovoracaceae bacterium]